MGKKTKIDFEKKILDPEPLKMFTEDERQEVIFRILHMNEGTKFLGFPARLKLWIKSINVRNMMMSMKDYVKELKEIETFPHLNFA